MKRTIAILTVVLLSMSMLVGCGGSSGTSQNTPASGDTGASSSTAATDDNAGNETASEASTTSDTDPFGKYAEPIEITSVKSTGSGTLDFPEGDTIDDNVWTRYYEETLGVKLRYLWTTNEQQYEQKLNIAITSNDLPDVMEVKNTQLKMMHENGQLMDMTEVLPAYVAPFTDEVLNADNGAGMKSASFDGRLFGIPKVSTGLLSAKIMWVRTDWLDNLGLSVPETVDDMLNVIDAFTNQDPDGNGANDTYGLAVFKDLLESGYACLEGFFNAYGAYPDIWVKSGDGLAYGSIQPEVKTALGVLQDMYSKGQLDPEFGVKDANKVNEDVSASRFGLMFGDFWNAAWINDVKVDNPDMEWIPAAIPSNNGVDPKVQIPFGTNRYYVVSAKAEHPEAIVKMLNLQLEKGYGETAEPTVFNVTPEGYGTYLYNIFSLEPGMKNFDAAERVTKAIETGDTSDLNTEELNYYEMSMLSLNGDHSNNNWHQLKMFGPAGSLTVIDKYWTDGNILADAFYGAPTQTMSEKLSTLKKQQLTDFTSIILGASLDEFDNFVKNWENLGGAKMTEEVNEWYAEQ